MIKNIFKKYNIKFQRKNRSKVFFQLTVNLIVEKIWRIRKRLLGIGTPVIHLYAVCWNEEKIIPFMIKHYNEFVNHYFIYDNNSNDSTNELLLKEPNVTVRKYDTGGTFNDVVHQQIKNSVWKKSRGKADWVIVIDMDELIYHSNMKEFLKTSDSTIFKPFGFNMVSDEFPFYSMKITEQVKSGVPDSNFGKMVLFNPHRIVDINYMPGAHEAYPEGIVNIGVIRELKLLHYKNLGVNYVMNKITQYNQRISEENKELGYGFHYEKDRSQIETEINKALNNSIFVID